MIDDKTSGFAWPIPHAQNLLSDDVERLRAALSQIDGALTEEQAARQQHASSSTAHAASAITATPVGSLTATTVQDALGELDATKAAAAHGHIASAIPVTPTGSLTATTVQGALAELDSEKLPTLAGMADIGADLSDGDQLPVQDVSAGTVRSSTLSRVWTYVRSKITGAISGVVLDNLVQDRAVITDANGKLAASGAVSATELGYLDGVTAPLQSQLNGKAALSGATFSGTINAQVLTLTGLNDGEGGQLTLKDAAGVVSFWLDDTPGSIRFASPSENPKPLDFIVGPGDPVRMRILPSGAVLIGKTIDNASGKPLQVANGATLEGGLWLGAAGWGGANQGLYLHERASGYSENITFLGSDGVTPAAVIGKTPLNSVVFRFGDTVDKAAVRSNGDITTVGVYLVGTQQVVGPRRTGWATASGTASRAAFATNTVTTEQLAQRLKALLDDLTAHGIIGA